MWRRASVRIARPADGELELGFRVRVRRAEREQGERKQRALRVGVLLNVAGTRRRDVGNGGRAWRHSAIPVATVKKEMTFLQITPWLHFPFSNFKLAEF